MKTNQVRAQNTGAAKSKQARKNTSPPPATSAAELQPIWRDPRVSEHLDLLGTLSFDIGRAQELAKGYFFLVASHFEKEAYMPVVGIKPDGGDADGIMQLGSYINDEIEQCEAALHKMREQLGSAELEAARRAAKGGAR